MTDNVNSEPTNEQSEMTDEELEMTDEELEAIREEMESNNPEDSEEGIISYATEGLDIIGVYEIEIYKTKKELGKLESKVEMLKMDIELEVEKEWIEKKTPELSNQSLRHIAAAKRIAANEEITKLNEAIESYQDTAFVQGAYMKNEIRAFKSLIAAASIPDEQ